MREQRCVVHDDSQHEPPGAMTTTAGLTHVLHELQHLAVLGPLEIAELAACRRRTLGQRLGLALRLA